MFFNFLYIPTHSPVCVESVDRLNWLSDSTHTPPQHACVLLRTAPFSPTSDNGVQCPSEGPRAKPLGLMPRSQASERSRLLYTIFTMRLFTAGCAPRNRAKIRQSFDKDFTAPRTAVSSQPLIFTASRTARSSETSNAIREWGPLPQKKWRAH